MRGIQLMIVSTLLVTAVVLADSEETVEDVVKVGFGKPTKGKPAVGKPVVGKPVEETTHRPVLTLPSIQIPLPQISFPQITLPHFHLPPLPHLPHLALPFKKEAVTVTKTVLVETTTRITRHPICVTAYGPKPPCLGSHHHALRELENDLDEMYIEENKPVIEPTKVVDLPTNRATARVEGTEEEAAEDEEDVAQSASRRTGRYLVPHPQYDDEQDGQRHGLIKPTHYITKTLYVTKVEKTIDHKVTATLVAKNCIPTEPRIPQCGAPLVQQHSGFHSDRTDTSETEEK